MGSVTDKFSFAMFELGRCLKPLRDADSSIYCHLTDFEDGFQFLSVFVDCIRNWSNALEVAPNLGSIVAKIGEVLHRIVGEFIEEVKVYKRASEFQPAFFNLLGGRSFKKRASKWIIFFQQWNRKIDALKPEIAEACDNSMSIIINNSVKCYSPSLNFHKWEKFAKSRIFCVNDQISRRRIEISIRWDEGPSFFQVLGNYYLQNPKIEAFLIKVGCSIFSVGMLSCRWWAKNFDPNLKQVVDAVFRDLGQKLGFTNPEFIDIILEEQKIGASISIAKIIVNRLVPSSGRGYIKNYQGIWLHESLLLSKLESELKYLLTTVLDIPKENVVLQIFLPDIKQLVMEMASLHHLLFNVNDRNVVMDFIRQVCLIKVEIFLRIEAAACNVFTSQNQINALNEVVSIMEESSEGSESNKFADQILMLVKELATDAEGIPALKFLDRDFIVKKTLKPTLLLKTLLIKGELLFLKLQDKLFFLASFKYSIEALHTWFKIIIPLVIKDENLIFSDIEVVASKIISLYHQILDQDISNSKMVQSMKTSVSNVVDEVNVLMKEFKHIYLDEMYLRVRHSNFPKTNAAGFIDSLLRKLQDLLSYGMDLVESVITKEQIAEIMVHLQFFQTYLWGDISMEDSKHGGARLINIC